MRKILIIDDDPFFIKTVSEALPDKYSVITAKNGEIGLEKFKSEKPDIILVDIMMPKLDGISFIKEIKKTYKDNEPMIPILVSSNLSSVKKVSDVMALGAVGYVIKSEESLSSIVQNIERILGEEKESDSNSTT